MVAELEWRMGMHARTVETVEVAIYVAGLAVCKAARLAAKIAMPMAEVHRGQGKLGMAGVLLLLLPLGLVALMAPMQGVVVAVGMVVMAAVIAADVFAANSPVEAPVAVMIEAIMAERVLSTVEVLCLFPKTELAEVQKVVAAMVVPLQLAVLVGFQALAASVLVGNAVACTICLGVKGAPAVVCIVSLAAEGMTIVLAVGLGLVVVV